uniref:Uncharacterized protein n=1 Tax=Oryza glumipatula TaxID=40148 RepID=A0A0E0AS84_9ORYZ
MHGLVREIGKKIGRASCGLQQQNNPVFPSLDRAIHSVATLHAWCHEVAAACSRRLRRFGHHRFGKVEEWNRNVLLYILSFDLAPISAAVCRRRA